MRLRDRLTARVRQHYPNFEKMHTLGASNAYHFTTVDCRDWHTAMTRRILDAVEYRKHFPVFRISHGEFILALGFRHPKLTKNIFSTPYIITLYHRLREQLGLAPAFRSGSKHNSYEEFTKDEMREAKRLYVQHLSSIATDGLLAAAFYDNPGFSQFLPDYFDWLDDNAIRLTSENYMSFYSIYVFLADETLGELVRGRNILVVTSFPRDKKARIISALQREGAASVHCLAIDPSKAIFEKLPLNQVQSPIDVALIGAGVGASAMIEQLRPLNCVSIDAGFAIDMIAFPDLRYKRPYCLPDPIFDLRGIEFFSPARHREALIRFGAMTGHDAAASLPAK